MNSTNMVLREEKVISEVLEFLKALPSTRNKTYMVIRPVDKPPLYPIIEA